MVAPPYRGGAGGGGTAQRFNWRMVGVTIDHSDDHASSPDRVERLARCINRTIPVRKFIAGTDFAYFS